MNRENAYTENYWEGEGYKAVKDKSSTEIYAMIRKEVRAYLKKRYPGVKASVRGEWFSGGSSVNVSFKELPRNPFKMVPAPWAPYGDGEHVCGHANWYKGLEKAIKRIVNKYNYSDCESMIDYFHVNYYVHVGVYWETARPLEEAVRAEWEKEKVSA